VHTARQIRLRSARCVARISPRISFSELFLYPAHANRVRRFFWKYNPRIKGVADGGDFNTNHDQAMFAAERTLNSLADAGYQNGFEKLLLPERVTHPGTHGFPDATFDYLFAKRLTAMQLSITPTTASDHWPVTRNFRLH
jgi:hypothetical protein